MYKYYAKTIAPEHADNLIYLEDEMDFYTNFIIDGGREFMDFNDKELQQVKKTIDNFYEWEYHYGFRTLKEYLEWYLPSKVNHKKLSPVEIKRIKDAYNRSDLSQSNWEKNLTFVMLSIVYCTKMHLWALRGCSQGDYVELWAPENTSSEIINRLETLYWNLGSEVIVDDESESCESPDDVCGYGMYITEYDVKEGLAKQLGCNPEEIKLWEFDHWGSYPVYKSGN